ncbi:MAG TPA: GFA family protein [Casimicrobiaceae bacterium]|nr:GFA family protein [Casimicrobiaceae bacterium]
MSNGSGATRHATGGCLCRAVRYEVDGELRDVVLCHCEMCRRTHGHVAAYTAAERDEFRLVESRGLRWYVSSPIARRGFCAECGASLFWEREGGNVISIAAGSVDAPTGLATTLQIFVDSAGDYYDIDERIAQRREWS